MKSITVVTLGILLAMPVYAGPAEECLASFAQDLKDPESGRVIAFADNLLTYTATNSYGARTKGNAICTPGPKGYVRDAHKEYIAVLDRATEMMTAFVACRDAGKSVNVCAKGSTALKMNMMVIGEAAYVKAVKKEAQRSLGF